MILLLKITVKKKLEKYGLVRSVYFNIYIYIYIDWWFDNVTPPYIEWFIGVC